MDGKKRNDLNKINRLLDFFPVVMISGVRQCGKTTLARQVRPDWNYFDLENPNHFDRIHSDPVLFFKENPQNIILDEAQKSPKLFETLRGVVDQNREQKSRFIITGSSSLDLLKNVSESLAGRVGLVELGTFKMNEFYDEPLSDFYELFQSDLSDYDKDGLKKLVVTREFSEVQQVLLRGGYPEPFLKNDPEFHKQWMDNYIKTYVNQDIRDYYPNLDIIKYRRLVEMLSYISGTIINKSELARSIETSEKTIRDYIDIIEGTYFWRSLPAFRSNKVKTTLKLPKGFFRDSGVSLFLQNIFTTSQMSNYPFVGRIFENFVIEEIIKGLQSTMLTGVEFFHYRTKNGAEIDLIVKGPFGILPIEIKYGTHTPKKQLRSLMSFIDQHDLPMGVVINNSNEVYYLTEKIIQIPVGVI